MPSNTQWPHIAPMSTDQLNELVEIQSTIFELIINKNEAFCSNPNLSPFHSVSAFSFPIKDYMSRYIKGIGFNEVHLIVTQIFLDRYLKSNQQYPLTKLNIFRLLAATNHLAHKFCEETGNVFPLSHYASMAGLSIRETKQLEIELLANLDFNLFITPDVYLKYKQDFVNFAHRSHGNGKSYSLSMHPDELAMLEELRLNPLYQPPTNADVLIDPNLLADEEVAAPLSFNLPASATMPAAGLQPSYQIPAYLLSPITERSIFQPSALGTSSLAPFSPSSLMTFEPASSSGYNHNQTAAASSQPAAAAGTTLAIQAFNSTLKALSSVDIGACVQGEKEKTLVRKTPSLNTSATEVQTLDVDDSNLLHRKKKKTTIHAYDPRFLAAVSAPELPNECISNQESASNPGCHP